MTAEAILADGFVSAGGYCSTDRWWEGVWLFDRPLLASEGGRGKAELLIHVDIPQVLADLYPWGKRSTTYREWLIPAEILNRFPRALVGDP